MRDIMVFKERHDYNDELDALFIHCEKNFIYNSSIELDHDIILDFDDDCVPVAIEVLNTSKHLNVPKDSLKTIDNIHVNIKVTEKSIFLELRFKVYNTDKKQEDYVFDLSVHNSISLPNVELKIAK